MMEDKTVEPSGGAGGGASGGGGGGKVRRRPGRVPTSCAECRRLKLRCDKNIPCEKCVSRGVAGLCPQGTLPTGKSSRQVLANTEDLQDKIESLRGRVRELEDALRALQAASSNSPHPLLLQQQQQQQQQQQSVTTTWRGGESESSQTKSSVSHDDGSFQRPPSPMKVVEEDEERQIVSNSIGTLRVGSYGQTTFIGRTARSEYLARALDDRQPVASNITSSRLPKLIVDAPSPDIRGNADGKHGQEIFAQLPPVSEAMHLCEVYLEHGQCLYVALPRDELLDDILTTVYRAESFDSLKNAHGLSLLFIVFALAILFDPSRKPYSGEAQEYFLLSRALLNLSSCGEATLLSVQSMIHIAQYHDYCEPAAGSHGTLMYTALGVQSAYSMGLHLSSAHWSLGEETTQKRSRVYWQLFLLDTWMSFTFGRPPMISPTHVDCGLPRDMEQIANKDSQLEMGFHSWAWRYARLLRSVMSTAFGTKTPPYSTVLDLDGKIRDFAVPYYLRPICKDDRDSPILRLQRWSVHTCKEATLLNLHRCYFAQALRDLPSDLLKHTFGPSVMAIYRSAWRLVESLVLFWNDIPHILSRISLAWSQALSAAIVMCLFVTRAPSSCLAISSLEELDKVAALFKEAAPDCRAATNNLELIQRLRRKAHECMGSSPEGPTGTLTLAELDRLGGKTVLISDSDSSMVNDNDDNDSHRHATSLSSLSVSMPIILSDSSLAITTVQGDSTTRSSSQNMHPTIVRDMLLFDGFGTAHRLSDSDLFDYPSGSLPPDTPEVPVSDTTGGFVHDVFNVQSFSNIQSPSPCFSCGSSPTTILDASWQSFMDQLGF